MRTASRVFFSIGLFGLIADLIFATGNRFQYSRIQGPLILTFFFVACMYISLLLRRQGQLDVEGLTLPEAHDAHDDGEIHLPGPSWYPAFYGVTLLLVVMGLVFDHRILIAGIVLTVLTTIGWGVESVRDYRREIAHHRPEVLPPVPAIALAQRVLAFRREHGGADAVVQHLGRGGAEIVLVGSDGGWGSLVTRDVATAREAAALAGTTLHDGWPSGLGARVRTGEEQWRAMGGESAFAAPSGHEAPRDGSTQVAGKVFLSLAIFALFADILYATASKFRHTNLQGIAILTTFAIANVYLYIGLKNAKARPEDRAYAGDGDVTIEPQEPDPPIDPHTLHLPGPSWWPAFFSVALGVLVWGLVFHLGGLLLGGIGATVLCCVGWGVESVHEYRQSIAGHGH